jgi:putative transposase
MPNYRRLRQPGGTFFFTLVTFERQCLFDSDESRRLLHAAIAAVKSESPFSIDGCVLLPDHLHAIWTLPGGDSDYSVRWGKIKKLFTTSFLEAGGVDRVVSQSRMANHRRGVWQRRFWEHCIRDDRDYTQHLAYIHFNPVKHGYVGCPHSWPYSSFHRHVQLGNVDQDWSCSCRGQKVIEPDFSRVSVNGIE